MASAEGQVGPNHQWEVEILGREYGLTEWGSDKTTAVVIAGHLVARLPVPIEWAAAGLVGMVFLVALVVAGAAARSRRDSSERRSASG